MKIRVRFFASLKEAMGREGVEAEAREGEAVAALLERLKKEYPQLIPFSESIIPVVNDEYVEPSHRLRRGDELALIPPVSGGRDG